MKNKVTIFVGPIRSGKSILMHSYIKFWGGLEKIAYCDCNTGYKSKMLEYMKDRKVLVLDDLRKRDLFKLLDGVVNYGIENVKPIFVLTNDMPKREKLKKYDFVQVFEFTPAKCVYPGECCMELWEVFSNVRRLLENEK